MKKTIITNLRFQYWLQFLILIAPKPDKAQIQAPNLAQNIHCLKINIYLDAQERI